MLAESFYHLNRLDEAIENARKADTLNAHYYEAASLMKMGRTADAIQVVNKALQVCYDYAKTHDTAHHMHEQFESLRLDIGRPTRDTIDYWAKGDEFYEKGLWADALDAYNATSNDKAPRIRRRVLHCLYRLGRYQETLDLANEFLKREKNAWFYLSKADALHKLGNVHEAIEVAENALSELGIVKEKWQQHVHKALTKALEFFRSDRPKRPRRDPLQEARDLYSAGEYYKCIDVLSQLRPNDEIVNMMRDAQRRMNTTAPPPPIAFFQPQQFLNAPQYEIFMRQRTDIYDILVKHGSFTGDVFYNQCVDYISRGVQLLAPDYNAYSWQVHFMGRAETDLVNSVLSDLVANRFDFSRGVMVSLYHPLTSDKYMRKMFEQALAVVDRVMTAKRIA